MSDSYDPTAPPKKKFPGFAFFFGLLWAAGLGAIYYFRPAEGEEASVWWSFLGRFHPLIVHLPIGLIMIVPLLEIVGRFKGKDRLRASVPTILWLTVLGAAGSTVLGYLLMLAEPDDSVLMQRHFWSGLAFGGLALVALLFRLSSENFFYYVAMIASLFAVAFTGHLGGALVHGTGYLTKFAPESMKPYLEIGFGEEPLAPLMAELKSTVSGEEVAPVEPEPAPAEEAPAEDVPLTDKVVFDAFVLPIMEAKCTECHNEDKTKGKLRLDTHELIMAGVEGADYPNVEPGNSEDSELIYRVVLPTDDDDFMPPDGKDPLTPEEIKVLRWWIDSGASADATVADLEADDEMTGMLLAIDAALEGDEEAAEAIADAAQAISEWDLLTPEEREERMNEVLSAAEHYNFSVMPISAEDNRLKVNVVNASGEFGDEQLATLDPVAERILWLDLGRSQVSDDGMKTVGHMRNLERLHLENTKITDAGIAKLAGLTKLEYLNLYGTDVTSAIFEPLAKARNLRKLYLWQTRVDPAEAKAFQRSMSLEVNIGTELAAVAKAEETKQPEEKKETEAKAEPAKAEPKKEVAANAKPKAEAKKVPSKPAAPKEAKPAAPTGKKEQPPKAAEAKAKPVADKTPATPASKKADATPADAKPAKNKADAPPAPVAKEKEKPAA